jgi:hypothetical protein
MSGGSIDVRYRKISEKISHCGARANHQKQVVSNSVIKQLLKCEQMVDNYPTINEESKLQGSMNRISSQIEKNFATLEKLQQNMVHELTKTKDSVSENFSNLKTREQANIMAIDLKISEGYKHQLNQQRKYPQPTKNFIRHNEEKSSGVRMNGGKAMDNIRTITGRYKNFVEDSERSVVEMQQSIDSRLDDFESEVVAEGAVREKVSSALVGMISAEKQRLEGMIKYETEQR